ncbi:MAG: sugar nucleotide-binding protein [Clostridia bacterium]
MKKIMLTGATGFLGSRLMEYLHTQADCQLLAFAPGMLRRASESDICAQVDAFAPDALIHTAAISSTGYCEQHEDESYRANVLLPQMLAVAAKKASAKLLFCSSDQVYNGTPGAGPYAEDAPLCPQNIYGRHKLEAEQRILALLPSAVGLRLTWLYDFPAYGLPTHANLLLNLFQAAALQQSIPCSAHSFRGITYARQLAALMLPALHLAGGIYNFGSENEYSMLDTTRAFLQAMGLLDATEALLVPDFQKPLESLSISCQKLKQNGLCFDTTVQGIQRCMADYRLA